MPNEFTIIQIAPGVPKPIPPEVDSLAQQLSAIHGPLRIMRQLGGFQFYIASPAHLRKEFAKELVSLRLIVDVNMCVKQAYSHVASCKEVAEFYTLEQLLLMPILTERDYATTEGLNAYRAAIMEKKRLMSEVKGLFGNGTQFAVARRDNEKYLWMFQEFFLRYHLPIYDTSVAVRLGVESPGLCAIGYRCEETLKTILDLNPLLANTLVTFWHDFGFVWVRVNGWYPTNVAFPGITWISGGGLVPIVSVPMPSAATVPYSTGNKTIATLSFSEINWPDIEMVEEFALLKAQDAHGKLIQPAKKGRWGINLQTVAVFFADTLVLTYDSIGGFKKHYGVSVPESVPLRSLSRAILVWLQRVAAENRDCFSVNQLGLKEANQIISILKNICLVNEINERELLGIYITLDLELKMGSSLTIEEVYDDYADFCKSYGSPVCPKCCFRQVLPILVRRQFGLTKSHDIKRPSKDQKRDTARNGFNNLGFKHSPDAADKKDEPDGPDSKSLKTENSRLDVINEPISKQVP